ncbi:hypothetical protein C0J50_17429 [Silurus asotus]|uniref:Uncharacterized protein n=1 Tax=Silurus asotus TaxID=30991 RepID=A0AAD5AV79_SILAS|nr:hypothetical protein C0J50_17429 [Silurus asotus]
MEEAYTALYQEFLRLQLLCLKQAEMLRHLTEALRRQQGVTPVFNGNFEDLYSETVPCSRDELGMFTHAEDRAQAAQLHKQDAHTHVTAAQTHQTHTFALNPTGITDLNRLHLETVQKKVEVDGVASALASGRIEKEGHSILDELRQVEHNWYSSQTSKQQSKQLMAAQARTHSYREHRPFISQWAEGPGPVCIGSCATDAVLTKCAPCHPALLPHEILTSTPTLFARFGSCELRPHPEDVAKRSLFSHRCEDRHELQKVLDTLQKKDFHVPEVQEDDF